MTENKPRNQPGYKEKERKIKFTITNPKKQKIIIQNWWQRRCVGLSGTEEEKTTGTEEKKMAGAE
jgi:P pilus assembly chaperone PapD